MTAMYGDVVRKFAGCTRKNLKFIESHLGEPGAQVFEVTQLTNSMLGLLVFPQQKYFDEIPSTPLSDLESKGWPRINSVGSRPCENLNQLVTCLRNSVAHFNIEFLHDEPGEITGLHVWNARSSKGPKTWEAYLTIQQLKIITDRFIEMLERGEFGRG